MLGRLRRHPVLVGAAGVLADAVRYLALMLLVILLLGQAAGLVL